MSPVRPATKRLLDRLVEHLPAFDQKPYNSPVAVVDDWHQLLADLDVSYDTGRRALVELATAGAIHHFDPMTSGKARQGRARRRVIVLNTAHELVREAMCAGIDPAAELAASHPDVTS